MSRYIHTYPYMYMCCIGYIYIYVLLSLSLSLSFSPSPALLLFRCFALSLCRLSLSRSRMLSLSRSFAFSLSRSLALALALSLSLSLSPFTRAHTQAARSLPISFVVCLFSLSLTHSLNQLVSLMIPKKASLLVTFLGLGSEEFVTRFGTGNTVVSPQIFE